MECACLRFSYGGEAARGERAGGRTGPTSKALLCLSSTLVLYP